MQKTRAHSVAGAAALLLVLTGCTAASDGESAQEESPLGEYMAALWGGDLSEDEQAAMFEAQNLEREELMATCMKEQGFDYAPNVDTGASYSSGEEWQPDDREWVAQYGYGMVRWPGMDEQPDAEEVYEDPNQEYVASLTATEQTAFYEALYGPSVPEEELDENGSYEWNWETAGCYGWAQHEIDGDNPLTSEEFAPLMEEINQFYTDLDSASGMSEIDAEWSACMSEAGHAGFARQSEAMTSITDELNAYYENQTEWVEDDPALDELAEREIELALADLDCRESTDYRERRQEVVVALEEEFIADHQVELDAMKAAAEQRS